jgi:hypothetical protein
VAANAFLFAPEVLAVAMVAVVETMVAKVLP